LDGFFPLLAKGPQQFAAHKSWHRWLTRLLSAGHGAGLAAEGNKGCSSTSPALTSVVSHQQSLVIGMAFIIFKDWS